MKDKKEQAEWIIAQKILGEIITNDFSKESYERYAVTDLFTGQDNNCKISWETWKKYYTENLYFAISKLKDSTEYKDIDGNIVPLNLLKDVDKDRKSVV